MPMFKVTLKSREDGIRVFKVSSQDEPTVYKWLDVQRRFIAFDKKAQVTVEEDNKQ